MCKINRRLTVSSNCLDSQKSVDGKLSVGREVGNRKLAKTRGAIGCARVRSRGSWYTAPTIPLLCSPACKAAPPFLGSLYVMEQSR